MPGHARAGSPGVGDPYARAVWFCACAWRSRLCLNRCADRVVVRVLAGGGVLLSDPARVGEVANRTRRIEHVRRDEDVVDPDAVAPALWVLDDRVREVRRP